MWLVPAREVMGRFKMWHRESAQHVNQAAVFIIVRGKGWDPCSPNVPLSLLAS